MLGVPASIFTVLIEVHLRQLHTFVAAADHRHFGSAARALGVQQPTVSRHVRDLEDELGLTLFDRSNGGVRLTNGGEIVLKAVRRVLVALDDAVRAATSSGRARTGTLRLGVLEPPASGLLQRLLAEYRRHSPDVTLTLVESNNVDLQARLAVGGIDAAVMLDETVPQSLDVLPLWRERLIAAVPEAHPLAMVETVTWVALAKETVLVQAWETCSVPRELLVRKMGVTVDFIPQYASQGSVLALVGAGYGVNVVLDMVAGVPVPGVVFRPIAEPDATTGLVVAWAPGGEDPLAGRFVAFLRDEVKRMGARPAA